MVGPGAWLAMAGAAAYLIATALGRHVSQLPLRITGTLIMTIAVSAWSISATPLLPGTEMRPPGSPGGWLAVAINDQLVTRFAVPGTTVILAVTFWIGALLAMDEVVLAVPRALGRMVLGVSAVKVPKPALAGIAGRMAALRMPWHRNDEEEQTSGKKKNAAKRSNATKDKKSKKHKWGRDDEFVIDEDAGGVGATESFDPDEATVDADADEDDGEWEYEDEEGEWEYEYEDEEDADEEAAADGEDEDEDEAEAEGEDDEDAADAPNAYLAHKRNFDPDELRAKIKKLPINFAPRTETGDAAAARARPVRLPVPGPRSLGRAGDRLQRRDGSHRPRAGGRSGVGPARVQDSGRSGRHRHRAGHHHVRARLAPGIKVSQITAVDNDIARALKAPEHPHRAQHARQGHRRHRGAQRSRRRRSGSRS